MKKKITAMLLAICCISSTWTVYADDFSSEPEAVVSDESSDEDASAEMRMRMRTMLRSQKTQMQMMKCFLTGQKAVLPVGISVQWLIRS